MKQVAINLYQIDELSDAAQDKAINEFDQVNIHPYWHDGVADDFVELCRELSIDVDHDSITFIRLTSGRTKCSFEGLLDPAFFHSIEKPDQITCLPEHLHDLFPFPVDSNIIDLIQRGYIDIDAGILSANNGKSVSMSFSYWLKNNKPTVPYPNIYGQIDILKSWLDNFFQRLNEHLLYSLKKQYELLTSDEMILQTLRDRKYWFTSRGTNGRELLDLSKETTSACKQ